ncbi:MAG: SCO family protein [Bdellovibrionaceae bacterium]|nr:SCO family protein [Pseudobdellovibrionaceae bacterium]
MNLIKLFLMVMLSVGAESSIYGLKTVWKDQNNQSKVLNDFSGKPTLITMVYTSCAHTCPMTISKVEEIKKSLEKAGLKDFRLVLASFDDVVDKPDHLKAYMLKRKLDPSVWTFLSPVSQKESREMSVLLGISFKKLGEGEYSHSNVITLLDKNGVPVAKIDNLSSDISTFEDAVKKLK